MEENQDNDKKNKNEKNDDSLQKQEKMDPEKLKKIKVEKDKLKQIITAILFLSDETIKSRKITSVFDADKKEVNEIMQAIKQDLEKANFGFFLDEVASGFKLATRPELAGYLKEYFGKVKVRRLNLSALETLIIIAYNQPITKAEIDNIRGVDSDSSIRALIDRDLITITGRKEDLGRPFIYGTTEYFLEYFGLNSLRDLPEVDIFKKNQEAEEIEDRNDSQENQ